MQHRPRRRTARWFAAVSLAVLVAGCGESPLESVGERSNEWIGPIADGVVLLSNDSPSTATTVVEVANDSVRVSETNR